MCSMHSMARNSVFPSGSVSAPRTACLIFTILTRNLFTEQNCGSNEYVTTHERTRGQKNSARDICRPSDGGGTFFVIKRSEIPEKASSRIKRTADIKVQSEIRRLRKKRDERRKRWLLFAWQMAV